MKLRGSVYYPLLSLLLLLGSVLNPAGVSAEEEDDKKFIQEEIKEISFTNDLETKKAEKFAAMASGMKQHLKQAADPDNEIQLLADVFEVEPNDDFSQADAFNLGDYVLGTFGWWEDIDIFQFEINSVEDIGMVGTQESIYNDLGFILVDSSYNPIIPDEAMQEDGIEAQTYYGVPPGTYYIFVMDAAEVGGDGLYALTAFSMEDGGGYYDNVLRISGSNRYETAVAISDMGWPEGADTVILARDITFPDALAGAPLAYQEDAPILLNPKNYLHESVKNQIRYLGATNVIILGGTGAILSSVERELRDEMGLSVKRIGGKSRYDTAAKIAAELNPYNKAVVAYGGNFPDALSVAPYAAENGLPILLSQNDSIPSETQAALKDVSETIVVGGTGVISEKAYSQLKGKNPTRIAGSNRYDTSVRIAKALPMSSDMITVATGENFADALTGSVLAAKYSEPIILVGRDEVPSSVGNYIGQQNPSFFTILGGEAAVSNKVIDQLVSY